MANFVKPRIFSSKCLGFEACRWNGVSIPDAFVEKLKGHVSFVTACPEAEIGLGIPRDPIRIVFSGDKYRLMQLNTGRDLTSIMKKYCADLLDGMGEVDGFILKDRSPSCGIKDVKVYPRLEPSAVIKRTDGFFGGEVIRRYPGLPVETEGRLTNLVLRESFLTKIYTFARFRKMCAKPRMKDLVDFHADNKFLLMAYNQKALREMGKIVANHEKKPVKEVFNEYRDKLTEALSGLAKYKANINVMMHALGYFSRELSADEKKFFLNTLEEYRREQVPLSVPLSLIRSYIVRFEEEYLARQSFFEPYPSDFVAIRDSGKGRKR